MNSAAIEYVWKAILESERSNRLQFMDDAVLIKAEATRFTQQPPDQSDHRDRAAADAWRLSADDDFTPLPRP